MPESPKRRRGGVLHLVLALVAGLAVGRTLEERRLRRAPTAHDVMKPAEPPPPWVAPPPSPLPAAAAARRRLRVPVRLAVAAAYAILFFAGAAVAAVAGDELSQPASSTPDTTTAAPAPVTTAAPPVTSAAPLDAGADPAPVETTSAPPTETAPPAPTDTSADPPAVDPVATMTTDVMPADPTIGAAPAATTTDAAPPAAPAATTEPVEPVASPVVTSAEPPASVRHSASRRMASRQPVHRAAPVADASEAPTSLVPQPYASTTWISRFAPPAVPEPPLLTRRLGRTVVVGAKRAGAAWPLVLGILDARGGTVGATQVRELAPRVAAALAEHGDEWSAALAVLGDATEADRAVALAHFDHAVGLETLVTGLDASKRRLVRRVLDDPRISIYPGGREDLAAGRVDVRVVAVIAYLADTFGSVDVSSLVSGHRLYARPGVISAHAYGDAVDIAALGGVPIEGHQQPGGITEQAVRDLLLLPQRLEPAQVISLLGLGGPSFPLPDHYDHIHVGY